MKIETAISGITGGGGGGGLSAEDAAFLKELRRKIPNMEDQIKSLMEALRKLSLDKLERRIEEIGKIVETKAETKEIERIDKILKEILNKIGGMQTQIEELFSNRVTQDQFGSYKQKVRK